MKTLTTTIAAIMLATSAHATDCKSSIETAKSLHEDLGESVAEIGTLGEVTEDNHAEANRLLRSVMRRLDTLESSLISVKVYCHDHAPALRYANELEDMIDAMRDSVK